MTKIVSIVGGGWSFKAVDHDKLPGTIIAINDAAFYLRKRPDFIVSMDRLWVQNRWTQDPSVRGGLMGLRVRTLLRLASLKSTPDWIEGKKQGWLTTFENGIEEPKFSESIDIINGPSSGNCGLNLAYIMRPDKLYLFGFDMCRNSQNEAYWHPPYPWAQVKGGTSMGRYREWAKFTKAAAMQFAMIGCEVINVSPMSAINVFKRASARELGMEKAA